MGWKNFDRRHYSIAAMVLILAIFALKWPFGPSFRNDDYAQYLLHAEAVAESRPYADTGYIFSHYAAFTGPPVANPGLPYTLAPMLAVSGHNLLPVKLFLLGSLLAFAILGGHYFKGFDPWLGAATALICTASLQLIHAPNVVGPDLTFCALIWGIIILADTGESWSPGRLALITAMGLVAILYRNAAVALLPALLVFAIVHFRRLGWRPLIPLPFWFLAIYFNLVILGAGQLPAPPEELHEPAFTLLQRIQMSAEWLWSYRTGVFTSHLYPFAFRSANAVYHGVSLVVMTIGIIACIRHRWRQFACIFTLVYGGMLVVLPLHANRYLWPLYPVLIFGFLHGLSWILRRVRPSLTTAGAGRITAVTAFFLVVLAATGDYVAPVDVPQADVPELRELFISMKERHQQQPMKAMFIKPRTLAWETGIPSMKLFKARTDLLLQELEEQGITHVVLGDLGMEPGLIVHWEEIISQRPQHFLPAFTSGTFTGYRFQPGGPASKPASPR